MKLKSWRKLLSTIPDQRYSHIIRLIRTPAKLLNTWDRSQNIKNQRKRTKFKGLTLISSPTELISLFAFWPSQYEPTLFKIWSIRNNPSQYLCFVSTSQKSQIWRISFIFSLPKSEWTLRFFPWGVNPQFQERERDDFE